MSELDAVLERLSSHEGVTQLILLGADGLVIQQTGAAREAETVAARIPGLAAAAGALGAATEQGDFVSAALEFNNGVAIVVNLSPELLLVALLRSGVGFAPLLRDLRRERTRLVELL